MALLLVSAAAAATRPATAPKKTSSQRKSQGSLHRTASHSGTAHSSKRSTKHTSKKGGWRTHGQQVIATDRARQIQEALIREHYLDGEPTGQWDARTKAAMVRYQSDNGWQTKKLPDSRALIKLGLGPDRSNLINPDTAFIAQPEPGKGGSQQP